MKVRKPLLRVGDKVYAKQTPSSDWQLGTIISCNELAEDWGYGPHRLYTLHFHNMEKPTEVHDYQVVGIIQYGYEKETDESKWVNVKRVYDKESKDIWAREMGWFCATYDGEDHHFVHLEDAVRAYVMYALQHEGIPAKCEDVNVLDCLQRWGRFLAGADEYGSGNISREETIIFQRRIHTVTEMKEIMPHGSDMKLIGDLLVALSEPDRTLPNNDSSGMMDQMNHMWKCAEKYYMENSGDLLKSEFFLLALLAEFSCAGEEVST